MRLTKTAILSLKGTNVVFKETLAEALGSSLNSMYRWISENEDNGPLTKAKAIQMIREETGLEDSQILEEDTIKEEQ